MSYSGEVSGLANEAVQLLRSILTHTQTSDYYATRAAVTEIGQLKQVLDDLSRAVVGRHYACELEGDLESCRLLTEIDLKRLVAESAT